jgi:hypothetical protein
MENGHRAPKTDSLSNSDDQANLMLGATYVVGYVRAEI